jgi:lysophospholipase L1-like esterase
MTPKVLFKTILISVFLVTTFKANAQDWAKLNRYQSENAALKPALKSDQRVVFMGNSITEGWKNTHPHFFEDHPYICRGISGQTTPQMLIRFRQDVIALQPKVVVILAGTNDIAGNTGPSTLEMIMDNIRSMAEIASANKIKVVLSSVLPASEYPWQKEKDPSVKIPILNEMIKGYCKTKDYIYLDYFSSMKDEKNGLKAEYTTDGVHCTAEGYDVMEILVQQAIKKALKSKK